MAPTASLLFRMAAALLERSAWPGRAALAAELGVNRGSLHGWLNHLNHHRAIDESAGLVVDPHRLLGVLAAHRVVAQRPETPFTTGLDPASIHETLRAADIPHVFGIFSAANQWAFFEPRRTEQLYVSQGDRGEARRLLRGRGRTIQLFVDRVDTLPMVQRGTIPITDPLLTVADLRAHPEGGAHAQFLQQNLLRLP